MKSNTRLDYAHLAHVLGERGVVDPQRVSLALQTAAKSNMPFPEVLVSENLVSDWDLSRVVCDMYGLTFLPVEIYAPSVTALEGLDVEFLRTHRLIPLDRNGRLLTVCMPAIVPAEVLGLLAAETDLHILPVVGTVASNNKWFEEHLPREEVLAALPADASGGWSNIFDEGDASVLMDLNQALPESSVEILDETPSEE